MPAKTPKQELTFAQARTRLDEILAELESDVGDVDELAVRLKEAAELIRFCRDRLSAARLEVRKVVAELVPDGPAAAAAGGTTDDDAADNAEDDEPTPASESDESGPAPGSLPF